MSTENDLKVVLTMLTTSAVSMPGVSFRDVMDPRDLRAVYDGMRDQGRTPQFGTLELMARILMLNYDPESLVEVLEHCQSVQESKVWLSKATNKLLYNEEFVHD